MNYDSILKRVRKAVKRIEDRETASSVHIVDIDDNIENLTGLVIIFTYSSPEMPLQPE